MNQEEKLELAVGAAIARRRVGYARSQAALLLCRAQPVAEAVDRFEKGYGREPNLEDPEDAAQFGRWMIDLGGGDLSWNSLEAAASASKELAVLNAEAARAMRAVTAAWQEGDGETVLDWLGCGQADFMQAVERAEQADRRN